MGGHFTTMIIALLPSILSGILLVVVKRQYTKNDEKERARDERETLTLEALNAIFGVTKELTLCVLYKKPPNGDLERSYVYKQDSKHKLEEYERRRAAKG